MTKQARSKVPVTMRALIQRINRKLTAEGWQRLKTTRGGRLRSEVGDYYVIDLNRNFVVSQHVDPESWGRELGVLHPWEKAVD